MSALYEATIRELRELCSQLGITEDDAVALLSTAEPVFCLDRVEDCMAWSAVARRVIASKSGTVSAECMRGARRIMACYGTLVRFYTGKWVASDGERFGIAAAEDMARQALAEQRFLAGKPPLDDPFVTRIQWGTD